MLTETLTHSQDIRGEYCGINEITDTTIFRNNVQISTSRHRSGPIAAGSLTNSTDEAAIDGKVYEITDVSAYSTAFQSIANALWTVDLHTAFEQNLRINADEALTS